MNNAFRFAISVTGVYLLCSLIAYMLGSISFSIIYSWLFSRKDVRDFGSGNAGATNVFRSVGVLPGILTFVCDLAKGALAIFIAEKTTVAAMNRFGVTDTLPYTRIAMCVAGLFALIGHLYPLYFKFRGGKGVLTLSGIVLMLSPVRLLCSLGVFLIGFLSTMTVSVGSCLAALAYPIVTFAVCYFGEFRTAPELFPMSYVWAQTVISALYAGIVLVKHSANIRRILSGTEPKLTIHRERAQNG